MRYLIAAVLAVAIFFSNTQSVAQTEETLTNQDVIEMVKAGLPESTILLSVKHSPAKFSTSAQDLIALKKEGVTQPVMDAMITRVNGVAPAAVAPAAQAGAPAAPQMVVPMMPVGTKGVVLIDGDNRISLMMSQTGTSYRAPSAMIPMNIGKKTNHSVTLPGPRSLVRTSNRNPIFEVTIPSNLHPEQAVAMNRLTTGEYDRQCLQSYESRGIATLFAKAQWDAAMKKQQVPFAIEKLDSDTSMPYGSLHRVILKSPLEPGEYAVAYQGRYWDFGVD